MILVGHSAAGYLTLTRKGAMEDFVPDIPAAERELVLATQGDWNSAFLQERVAAAAWKTRPSWVNAVADRMVPPQHERDSARRVGATLVTLDSGQVPMPSKPAEVAAAIVDAATRAGAAAAGLPR